MKGTKEVTKQKLEKYISMTEKALKSVEIKAPEGTHLYRLAEDVIDMAKRYFSDAKHFKEKGEYVTALSSVNFAHAYFDSGVRLGLLKATKNKDLFTID